MNKQEFKMMMANMANDYWNQEEGMIADMESDGEIPPLAMALRSRASLAMDFCQMIELIYQEEVIAESQAAIKAQARVNNQYR